LHAKKIYDEFHKTEKNYLESLRIIIKIRSDCV